MVNPNHRSSHVNPTPGSGGIGIVVGSLAAGVALLSDFGIHGLLVMILSLMIAAIGLRDDIRYLTVKTRLLVQVLAIGGLLFALMPFFSVDNITLYSLFLLGFMLFAGVWWLNLFNFMDGIDGMAGMQVIFMLLAVVALGYWQHPDILLSTTCIWIISLAAATAGFLLLNWSPARIFMGDVGSLYLAFMVFAIMLWSVLQDWMTFPVWLILGAAFITDTTTTLLIRILRGERWYEAHRSHVYQRLSRYWGSHAATSRAYLAVNLIWLTPLAFLALGPEVTYGWWLVGLAYAPLVLGSLCLGAGRPGEITKSLKPAQTPYIS